MKRAAFFAARLTAFSIFLITWLYGVTTYSAFAFDMFVKPRLFEPLNAFADWQHAWFMLAYVLSSVTLVPIMRGTPASVQASRRHSAARWLAVAYAVVIGGVAVWLLGRPVLPGLSTESRVFAVVPGALVPPLWLAVIDLLAVTASSGTRFAPPTTRHVFMAAMSTAVILSLAPFVSRLAGSEPLIAGSAAAMGWAVALSMTALSTAAFAFWLVAAAARGRRSAAAWEYTAGIVFLSAAIEELVRQIILPPLGFDPADRFVIAAPFGLTLSVVIAGLRARRGSGTAVDGVAGLFGITTGRPAWVALTLTVTAIAATTTIRAITPIDWASIVRQTISFIEAVLIFGALLSLWRSRGAAAGRIPDPMIAGVTLAAMLSLQLLAHLPASVAGIAPKVAVEQAGVADPFAQLVSGVLVARPPLDAGFYTMMNKVGAETWMRSPATPPSLLREPVTPLPALPNVFVFVFDSLRRDYLSVYNRAVTFTPAIGAWARESHVFENAFTPHGGTLLAAPALWAGRTVSRGWPRTIKNFDLLETLINRLGFDFLLNNSPTDEFLRPDTKVTKLDPFVSRVNTDLCQNLRSLETHLRGRHDATPVFAYSQPMNLHILNTLVRNGEPDYPGFYAPYAARLERMDQCFGAFVSYLKTSGLYDNSVIILSSDHGDMLGENRQWGHQAFLFPEIVRIPLIVHLPPRLAETNTTDLGRVALLTDLAPTLLSLLTTSGAADDTPPNGASLYVPRDGTPRPRDRESFLLIASYGPTYGLLRRNGRELYAVDLAKVREYEYLIDASGYRERPPAPGRQRVNQAELAVQLDSVRRLYARDP